MNLVGRIYIESGRLYLGKVAAFGTSIEQSRRDLVNKMKIVDSVISLAKINKNNDNCSQKNKNTVLKFLINMISMDIESIVKKACFKVVNDTSVSKEERLIRANGLIEIGKIFYDTTIESKSSIEFLKNKLN